MGNTWLGIVVAFHYVGVYVLSASNSVSKRMVDEELEKIKAQRESNNTYHFLTATRQSKAVHIPQLR